MNVLGRIPVKTEFFVRCRRTYVLKNVHYTIYSVSKSYRLFLALFNHEDYAQYEKLKSIDFWINFKKVKQF